MYLQLSLNISPILCQGSGEVKIGNQVWTNKNLEVSTFRNGEAIPEAKNAEEWVKAGANETAAFCYYAYDSKNDKVYGKLYNWYAVNDGMGLAPKGYHIPSDAEWTILTDFLGGEPIAGEKMKSITGWSNSGSGNKSSGFNGLPGGYCKYGGNFGSRTDCGYFWSSSEFYTSDAWYRNLYFRYTRVNRGDSGKDYGMSVRCLKD
jgi:uncharacterized protein (TIGR02145 family)